MFSSNFLEPLLKKNKKIIAKINFYQVFKKDFFFKSTSMIFYLLFNALRIFPNFFLENLIKIYLL